MDRLIGTRPADARRPQRAPAAARHDDEAPPLRAARTQPRALITFGHEETARAGAGGAPAAAATDAAQQRAQDARYRGPQDRSAVAHGDKLRPWPPSSTCR